MNYQPVKQEPAAHLAPAPRVADQFGVTRRTLSRWLADEAMAFPDATIINGRLYFSQPAIDEWKIDRARRTPVKQAA